MREWLKRVAAAIREFYRPCPDCEREGRQCDECYWASIW